jgi:hypothetical protein
MLEEAFYVEDSSAPKHKRARVSQVRKVVKLQSHEATVSTVLEALF